MDLAPQVESLFINAPLQPAEQSRLMSHYGGVSLTTANLTKSTEYDQVDRLTLRAYYDAYGSEQSAKAVAVSVETTFGVIRAQFTAPFVFAGGIVDRLGHFEDDVRPRKYAQNMVASHNLGIVLSRMMRTIDRTVGTGVLSTTPDQ